MSIVRTPSALAQDGHFYLHTECAEKLGETLISESHDTPIDAICAYCERYFW
jgi:hypothetical protein